MNDNKYVILIFFPLMVAMIIIGILIMARQESTTLKAEDFIKYYDATVALKKKQHENRIAFNTSKNFQIYPVSKNLIKIVSWYETNYHEIPCTIKTNVGENIIGWDFFNNPESPGTEIMIRSNRKVNKIDQGWETVDMLFH